MEGDMTTGMQEQVARVGIRPIVHRVEMWVITKKCAEGLVDRFSGASTD